MSIHLGTVVALIDPPVVTFEPEHRFKIVTVQFVLALYGICAYRLPNPNVAQEIVIRSLPLKQFGHRNARRHAGAYDIVSRAFLVRHFDVDPVGPRTRQKFCLWFVQVANGRRKIGAAS